MLRCATWFNWPWLASLFALALLTAQTRGQEANEPSSVEKQQIEAALKLTREAAGKYKFIVGNDDASPCELKADPVLRWSNPNVGEIHGHVFLWTKNTRPIAVGSLFKWFSPHTHTSHEFHSLSEEALVASYDGREVWNTKSGGATFTMLDKVEAPAETASRRLTQMRQLAKQFRGEETDREGEDYQLRLLPQPVYRYEPVKDTVVDGAMFAFVLGTDPEILLQLEARSNREGKLHWYFAASRMHHCVVRLKFNDREVWSVPQLEWSEAFDHTRSYTLFDTPGK